MVAMCLVLFALVGIYTMQAQSLRIVQSAHDSGAASQVLQQRVEQLRVNTYDTVATASGLLGLMNGTAGATQSELSMTAVKNFQETVKVSRYPRPGVSPAPAPSTMTVIRSNNTATSSGVTTDLRAESQLKAQLIVDWTDRQGSHRREFTTILSRGGVSASGITTRPETSATPLAGATP
jgi:Tfp pilus assembly protein PilV